MENGYGFRRVWTYPGPGGSSPGGSGGGSGGGGGRIPDPGTGPRGRNPAGPPPGGGIANGVPIVVISGLVVNPQLNATWFLYPLGPVPTDYVDLTNTILLHFDNGTLFWSVSTFGPDSWISPLQGFANRPSSGIYIYSGSVPDNVNTTVPVS